MEYQDVTELICCGVFMGADMRWATGLDPDKFGVGGLCG